ncbi:hypothetical protein LS73_003100 [Helicobacter muridarum]|uniref:Uncharacterized protein n=1 Tax=Helicobacter muridarum TaxID=216 RepID=A0A099TYX7_9HELI|nr:hypothetical protein [Helicobacter muridarum]TLE00903.1 hypothetical protein LS73_003100 [Helicobacter muridarum]STQ86677.1 Uncharacterised protein [Helicobacter muridarum]
MKKLLKLHKIGLKTLGSLGLASLLIISNGCASKTEEIEQETVKCESYKTYASATFEVEGDMNELVEKTAKKALTKSCFKKSDQSNANMRIKIQSTQSMQAEAGFIQDKHDNSFSLDITAIMLIPTEQGGLTTITGTQNANLHLKSTTIADFGSKSELSEKEIIPFIESNVLIALNTLFKNIS